MEIIYLVTVILENLIDGTLDHIGLKDCFFETYSVGEVHLAVIEEVMGAFKVFDSFFHLLNIEVVFRKEVLVGSLDAPVSSIEIIAHFLHTNDPDVIG